MEGSASQAGFYYQNNIAALKILNAYFSSQIYVRIDWRIMKKAII
jgi:hypothetical protein